MPLNFASVCCCVWLLFVVVVPSVCCFVFLTVCCNFCKLLAVCRYFCFSCFPLFFFCFSLFPPLSHALSPLPPWIVCRYVFSVNWSSVQLHLRCNGVSTLCLPMLDICRVLQNLLPTLRRELTVHPFKISPQNPQKIELVMLMQCLFAIGRQRVPQFLSNASNHLCHCIFDVTLFRVPLHLK